MAEAQINEILDVTKRRPKSKFLRSCIPKRSGLMAQFLAFLFQWKGLGGLDQFSSVFASAPKLFISKESVFLRGLKIFSCHRFSPVSVCLFCVGFFSKYIGTGIGVYPFFEDFLSMIFFYTRPFPFWMWGGYPPCSPKDVPILSSSQTHVWIPNLPRDGPAGGRVPLGTSLTSRWSARLPWPPATP